ncbi:hypothetical protein BGW42_008484 [Actinomortierella wolfii]|nr:hypothetical protein BGW42_008484 [Actinomortierella wolfii]
MEQFPFRELEATSLPMVDESVYPTITKPIRSNLDLPFRKLYNIEILDSSGTVHPALDRLKFDGPFMVKGWVPIEETILRRVEWTHEFNPQNIMQPIFWVNSENVCWYQVQTFSPVYTPIMAPLSDVCAYLDAIIQVIFVDKRVGGQSVVLPLAANKLRMSIEDVRKKVKQYRSKLIDLCSNDSELNHLQIYREWVAEQKLEDEACIVRSAPTADLPTQSGRATIKPISTSVHLSKPRAAIMTRSTSARLTVTNNLHPPVTISAGSSVASRTLSAPGAQADSVPTKDEIGIIELVDSPNSSLLSVGLEDLHVTTPAKRRRDYYFDLSSDTVEDRENVAKLHPSKKTPHHSPAEATILSDSDASEDVVVEIEPTVLPSQSLSDNIDGIDESEQGGSDTVSAPLIGQTASLDEDQLPLQPFQQSGAPSPYCALSDPGCPCKLISVYKKYNRYITLLHY